LVAKSADKAPQTAQIVIPVAERLGQMVIEADALAKAYGEISCSTNWTSSCRRAGSSA